MSGEIAGVLIGTAEILSTVFDIYSGASNITIPNAPHFISWRLARLALSKNIDMKHFIWENKTSDAITQEIENLIANHPSLISIAFKGSVLSATSKTNLDSAITQSKTIISAPATAYNAFSIIKTRKKTILSLKKAWNNRASQPLTYTKILEIEKALDAMNVPKPNSIDIQAARREIHELKLSLYTFAYYALSDSSGSSFVNDMNKDVRQLIKKNFTDLTLKNVATKISFKEKSLNTITTAAIALPTGIVCKLCVNSLVNAPRASTALGLCFMALNFKYNLGKSCKEQISSNVKSCLYLGAVALSVAISPRA